PLDLHQPVRPTASDRRALLTGARDRRRKCVNWAGVHMPIMAGISGKKEGGCKSLVMSGGYEDDRDSGDLFTYTGAGGRVGQNGDNLRDGPQNCDQTWANTGNASLKVSAHTKRPVRVVRGFQSNSKYAPAEGYRYDGLYIVVKAWMEPGRSGFQVCRFRLEVRVSSPSP
ncbi:SRA-YDG, partial [Epithele typhae]|uniref:SRA-YDG n=1 Tax=Epithele typhae TaxID=378194 RepID=UPI002007FBC9